jgi:hypothetical protein
VVSQQTPSTQWPEPHSTSVPHVAPFSFAHVRLWPSIAHELPAPHDCEPQQTPSVQKPLAQSASDAHVAPRSANGMQLDALQVNPGVQSLRPLPSHCWPHVVPTPTPGQGPRAPRGAPTTAEHVPIVPGTSHA